ncbi:MAG: hypothetical protein HFE26_00355 [Clostridia bacterium]|nr:hypothetical protein [Clostridia bacterium]
MQQFLGNLLISNGDWSDFQTKLTDLFNSMWVPMVAILAAACTILGIWIGLKWWRAGGDEQKRKEAKTATVSVVIGVVIMFAIAALLPILITVFQGWVNE